MKPSTYCIRLYALRGTCPICGVFYLACVCALLSIMLLGIITIMICRLCSILFVPCRNIHNAHAISSFVARTGIRLEALDTDIFGKPSNSDPYLKVNNPFVWRLSVFIIVPTSFDPTLIVLIPRQILMNVLCHINLCLIHTTYRCFNRWCSARRSSMIARMPSTMFPK